MQPQPRAESKLRAPTMVAKPLWLDPAFDDPEGVLDLARRSAPYPLTARVHKADDNGDDVPFFRIFWAHTREVKTPGAEAYFNNPRFIEAAKTLFDADYIVPSAIMLNLTTPQAGGAPHLDLPFFRGAEKFPFWLLEVMGYCDLFHDWAIPIASTLTWFYEGAGGDFEYWPDGPEAPSTLVEPPLWNVAVAADNEYMWHRVGPVGGPADFMTPGTVKREARLHALEDGGWQIRDEGRVWPYRADQVRLSILWKAYAFKDEAAWAAYRDRTHDLDPMLTARVFADDLAAKGIAFTFPDDPMADPGWKALIQNTYKPTFVA